MMNTKPRMRYGFFNKVSANRNETVGSTDVFHVLSKTAGNKNNETDAGNLGAADRAEEFEEVKA